MTPDIDESHFNVSITMRDTVTRQCPQSTTFEERREPKVESNPGPLSSLTALPQPKRVPGVTRAICRVHIDAGVPPVPFQRSLAEGHCTAFHGRRFHHSHCQLDRCEREKGEWLGSGWVWLKCRPLPRWGGFGPAVDRTP